MSLQTAFTNGKAALRRGAFGAAVAASLCAANAAQASSFTPEECNTIYGVSREVVSTLGKDTLSVDFRQSLVNFLGRKTCDGPTNIVTPAAADVSAWLTIRGILASGSNPIDLHARGLAIGCQLSNELTDGWRGRLDRRARHCGCRPIWLHDDLIVLFLAGVFLGGAADHDLFLLGSRSSR